MVEVFKESAFKHGYHVEDYREAVRNANLVFRSRRGIRNVYEILGRNDAGDHLHIITRRFRRGDDKIVIVFHVGPMSEADRKRFRRMIR